jgi:polar amino acid transport system permease protein
MTRREAAVRAAVVLGGVALVALAVRSVPGGVRWDVAWEWRGLFVRGLLTTAALSAGALVLALLLGVGAGLSRVSRSAALDQAAFTYVELVRGTPFLVQLYVAYFCVAPLLRLQDAIADVETVKWLVGVAGLGLFGGAYVAEIVRAAVESIDRGQWEAARSLGLSHAQTLFRVILPQCLRRMTPPLTGEAVSLVKESSLLSAIGVAEVTYHAKSLQSARFATFEAFLPLAALYLCVTLPLSFLARRLERRLQPPPALPVARL